MTDAGKAYLKQVKKALPGTTAQKKAYLKKLSADIEERLEEDPALDEAALIRAFGAPDEVAAGFLEALDTTTVKKAFGWKKIVLIGVIAAILIWLVAVITMWIDGHKNLDGIIIDYYGEPSSFIQITEVTK